jgi:phosphoribosylanthranilate isomerase/GNAT superfamily N-acetyltransferase
MIIKICGITNLEDAIAAAELGAEYLGFNFHPASPRCIAEAECEQILAALQGCAPRPVFTGVFVNHPPAEIERIVKRCGLGAAQLSGDEPPATLAALKAAGVPAFKAVRAPVDSLTLSEFAQAAAAKPALLLDASAPGLYGGTGRTVDWVWARGISARHPVFLAGGLTPENVDEAIRNVRPWGVDTASGVERCAGKKDLKKMAAFVQNARKADLYGMVQIESAQRGDAEEILALQKLAYRSEAEQYQDFSIPPLTQTREQIESEFGSLRFLRATADGHLIGSVRAELRDGTCHLGRLIVHPDWQNRGVGGRLLREAETLFPEADRFELFTGERSERNLHLYQKAGYREFKRQALNERITLVYLVKARSHT